MAIYKIFKEGEQINTIVANEEFVEAYAEENGYTYEEEIRSEYEPPIEPEEPTEPTGTDYDEMAEAIREGVNSI